MEVDVRHDCAGVDWKTVAGTLKRVGMAYHDPDMHRRAFEASHATVFVYHDNRLIGFGRAISDGVYQADGDESPEMRSASSESLAETASVFHADAL